MPRNPLWTASDAALTRANSSFQNPDGTLFFVNATTSSYDRETSFSGSFTAGESIDFLTVTLNAGSSYNFLATGDFQVSIAIYDTDGYLLQFIDGDDIGIPDPYPRDSLLKFKPDYTGTYKIDIFYANLTTTGKYIIVGSEDVFDDGKNTIVADSKLSTAIYSILRLNTATNGAAIFADLGAKTHAGSLTTDQALKAVVDLADATTSVATLSYEFFTGKTPRLEGLDYLLSPTGSNPNNLNSAYYQSFNLENRYINFAVNLGVAGEGKAKFSAEYGSLTLAEATKKAYTTIFGSAPTDAKVATLLSGGRDGYFESYGHDGHDGIGTKAAMVGWLLAEAAKADVGMYSRANNAYLLEGTSAILYAVDLVGVYGKPEYALVG